MIFTFKNNPGQIIIELTRFVGLCINQETSGNGISYVYSPHNIIMGRDIEYDKHCKLIFESYVEA